MLVFTFVSLSAARLPSKHVRRESWYMRAHTHALSIADAPIQAMPSASGQGGYCFSLWERLFYLLALSNLLRNRTKKEIYFLSRRYLRQLILERRHFSAIGFCRCSDTCASLPFTVTEMQIAVCVCFCFSAWFERRFFPCCFALPVVRISICLKPLTWLLRCQNKFI